MDVLRTRCWPGDCSRSKPFRNRSPVRKRTAIAGNLAARLAGASGGLPTKHPAGVGAPSVIYFASDLKNAIYKVVKK
jgi:hypothetical protein